VFQRRSSTTLELPASLTAKAKEEIQEKLRSEYIPKLTAFIDMSRSKLEEIIDVAMKEAVRDLLK